ncbi:hypothetical protein [Corynebacterium resistens]|nr:hypothetical protein [Corynebacterium resistens]
MHVREELVIEICAVTVNKTCELMTSTLEWPDGMSLSADGDEGEFDRKD